MNNIIFQFNIVTEKDVFFINSLYDNLYSKGYRLILIGWNNILEEWTVKPYYFQTPNDLNCFNTVFTESEIKLELEQFDISLAILLRRISWWYGEPNVGEIEKRINFFHFHFHFYLKLIKSYNPSQILIWNGYESRQFMLSCLADKFGISKMFFERGPLPGILFYDYKGILCKSSFVETKGIKFIDSSENYSSYNFDKYMAWYNLTDETLWEQPHNDEKAGIRERFNIPNEKKITLFIGQLDDDVQNKIFNPYFKSNIDAFDWFLKNCDPEYFILGKHHPKSKQSISEYQSKIKNKNAVWSDKLVLKEALLIADNIVTVNSSVIFDSLFYRKPILVLGETLLKGKDVLYEYSPINYKNVLNSFYEKKNHAIMLENFDVYIKYLFENHFLFINDLNDTEILSNLICDKSIVREEKEYCINHDFNLLNYLLRAQTPKIYISNSDLTFKSKLYYDIKWYRKKIKKFFKKCLF